MNTIMIEPLPNDYVRCTLSDQSTMALEVSKLPAWLVLYPMLFPEPAKPRWFEWFYKRI